MASKHKYTPNRSYEPGLLDGMLLGGLIERCRQETNEPTRSQKLLLKTIWKNVLVLDESVIYDLVEGYVEILESEADTNG